MRAGDSVRHRAYSWRGEVIAAASQPLLRMLDAKVRVRFTAGVNCFERDCYASDLELVQAAPVIVNGDTLPASGAVHDAVVGAIEDRLAERDVVPCVSAASIVYPRSFGGSNIVELSPWRRPDGGLGR